MTTELNRLLSLIDFTQEAVLSKTKPINHLQKLKELVLFEEDLKFILKNESSNHSYEYNFKIGSEIAQGKL